MTESAERPLPRVSPMVFPDRWDPPGKPDGAAATVQDAYRQTAFQLGGDLRLVSDGMNLQLQVVRDSYPSKYRTLRLAAMAMYWSRCFLAISDNVLLLTRGSYTSCPALVRSACEAIAAEVQAGGEEQPLFLAWLQEAMQPHEAYRATEIGLGRYFAGSTLASRPELAPTFRAASEFSRQHFGVTLLQVAPESNREKLAATFADQTFHFGWAQIILGWVLGVCRVQLDLVRGPDSPFHMSEETGASIEGWLDRSARALAVPDRCRIEEIDEDGERRFLLLNVRRQSSGAPRKLLL